jgi:hypothetical protein
MKSIEETRSAVRVYNRFVVPSDELKAMNIDPVAFVPLRIDFQYLFEQEHPNSFQINGICGLRT